MITMPLGTGLSLAGTLEAVPRTVTRNTDSYWGLGVSKPGPPPYLLVCLTPLHLRCLREWVLVPQGLDGLLCGRVPLREPWMLTVTCSARIRESYGSA